MHRIVINAGQVSMEGELFDSPTAKKIIEALPLAGRGNRWGEEFYFSIPVSAELEAQALEVVPLGSLGYWPTGKAFCIFFGPTPVSEGTECRAASAVNVIGKLCGDPKLFLALPDGVEIRIGSVKEDQ